MLALRVFEFFPLRFLFRHLVPPLVQVAAPVFFALNSGRFFVFFIFFFVVSPWRLVGTPLSGPED